MCCKRSTSSWLRASRSSSWFRSLRATQTLRPVFCVKRGRPFASRSEHVARVLDVGEHEGSPFIVMELLSGRDLASEIAERFVPSAEAVSFMLQICEALAAAHALGIVSHATSSLRTFILTRKSDGAPLIKVLDFGISKALDDPNLAPTDNLTMSHRLLGSPHYMSPEQARAPKAADARSDIWSLGVVLYELILGERPFSRGTPRSPFWRPLLSDSVPEVSAEQRRKMPDELMAVILRCLKREPEQRFANVSEFARALLPHGESALGGGRGTHRKHCPHGASARHRARGFTSRVSTHAWLDPGLGA